MYYSTIDEFDLIYFLNLAFFILLTQRPNIYLAFVASHSCTFSNSIQQFNYKHPLWFLLPKRSSKLLLVLLLVLLYRETNTLAEHFHSILVHGQDILLSFPHL